MKRVINMIFTKNDYFERVFYCSFTGFKVGIITIEEWESLDSEKRKGYIEYTVKFRPLTWGEHGKLRGECQRICPETSQRVFDYDRYSVKKLAKVVADWNLHRKDAEGNPEKIEPTEEAVGKLHPLIAAHMLNLYEEEVEMTKETEKN